jgi:hypothetical protein
MYHINLSFQYSKIIRCQNNEGFGFFFKEKDSSVSNKIHTILLIKFSFVEMAKSLMFHSDIRFICL